MGYTHLSQDERYQIQHLRSDGFCPEQIARQIHRKPSTVRRELRRNASADGRYHARHAQRQSVLRRHLASSRPRIGPGRWIMVEARLAEDWSPEQIAPGAGLSHERIYQYIARDRQQGGTLWHHLRHRKRRRRHRCGTPRERQRLHGRRITQRPVVVATRRRVGDTIVGKGRARIVTLVERKPGYSRLRRVSDGRADTVARAIIHALHPLSSLVHTLTLDNGSEFAEQELVDIALTATSHFAEPYSSWQRDCNENLNGLLRQYLPKGGNLAAVTDEQLQAIEDKLNDRPRKRLGFRTPRQVFEASFNLRALRN